MELPKSTLEKPDEDEKLDVIVTDVTKDNFIALWPTILFSIQTSTFIAIDLELSGLGDRKKLTISSIEERYKSLRAVAETRSVVSLGLACFQQVEAQGNFDQHIFKVQIFNIFLLCDDEYVVEAQSLQFLVSHGFDFKKQYSCGISYSKTKQESVDGTPSIRRLLLEIICAKKPLVLHNGFIDLVFLYQNFYSQLPHLLQTFIADLCEMFVGGLHDTKYLSEFHFREKFSFLEYLFKKCQYQNHDARLVPKPFLCIKKSNSCNSNLFADQDVIFCSLPNLNVTESMKRYLPFLCKSFRTVGYCPRINSCTEIHSVELMIIGESVSKKIKPTRKRRKPKSILAEKREKMMDGKAKLKVEHLFHGKSENGNGKGNNDNQKHFPSNDDVKQDEDIARRKFKDELNFPRLNGHRAGFDAFMTGYCFAFYQLNCEELKIQESKNKIFLTAKNIPLNVVKSHFAKTSLRHQKIISMLFKENEAVRCEVE